MPDATKTGAAWEKLFDAHPEILATTERGGIFEIDAATIKQFREPRLMAKFDTSSNLPHVLKDNALNILPNTNHSYLIGQFQLYENFPDVSELQPQHISLPDFQTLRTENLTSEANAINALIASKTLEHFLGEDELFETFNGRMGAGDFEFDIELHNGSLSEVSVHGAQIEIDGGFESEHSVVIMEAKNVIHHDFHVRQLYYPYRKYLDMVHKPIRLVFSQYTNLIYYLHEYKFEDPLCYSSIKHLATQAYTFADEKITLDDLVDTWKSTAVTTDDNQEYTRIPFIQADRFELVLALLERIASYVDGMQTSGIAEYLGYGYVPRQADYYLSAGEYLGLFDRSTKGLVRLTSVAEKMLTLNNKNRQLAFAALMFEHAIFHEFFRDACESGSLPDRGAVISYMRKYNVCNTESSTAGRRASSVLAWLRWLMSLPEDRKL